MPLTDSIVSHWPSSIITYIHLPSPTIINHPSTIINHHQPLFAFEPLRKDFSPRHLQWQAVKSGSEDACHRALKELLACPILILHRPSERRWSAHRWKHLEQAVGHIRTIYMANGSGRSLKTAWILRDGAGSFESLEPCIVGCLP